MAVFPKEGSLFDDEEAARLLSLCSIKPFEP